MARSGGMTQRQSARRILIVEDEALIAWNLQMMLEGFGHVVCGIAATSTKAVKLADEEKPDLILMDVRLADRVSGIHAAEQILAKRAVPIVFVTAFSDSETLQKISSLGAECLPKPIMPHMLDATLGRLLGPA